MKAHQIQDDRDRAAALRAEEARETPAPTHNPYIRQRPSHDWLLDESEIDAAITEMAHRR